MKRIILYPILLLFIIGNISAADTESYQFIDYLLSMSKPGAPKIYEDTVVFTAPSTFRRVGIAFAHEGYANIYWFKKLMKKSEVLVQPKNPKKPAIPETVDVDSGILFHTYSFSNELKELGYRLVVDGLWTTDPANPARGVDQKNGISYSVVELPVLPQIPAEFTPAAGEIRFNFTAPSGETITVAGNFNNWDPFMYELKETRPGQYSLALPLPPGIYHYVFFHRGQRLLDPRNPKKGYDREGTAASEAQVQ